MILFSRMRQGFQIMKQNCIPQWKNYSTNIWRKTIPKYSYWFYGLRTLHKGIELKIAQTFRATVLDNIITAVTSKNKTRAPNSPPCNTKICKSTPQRKSKEKTHFTLNYEIVFLLPTHGNKQDICIIWIPQTQ